MTQRDDDMTGQMSEEPWFLPGPAEPAPEPDPLLPGASRQPGESDIVAEWLAAQAALAMPLARLAQRLGALDERLARGPEGWRHRLALIEAAELGWFTGDRIAPDRLALWVALRLSGVQDDMAALTRAAWAVRRLTGGPGPMEGLADFLGRRDPREMAPGAESLSDRASAWAGMMEAARALHPIARAAMGFHLWALAGLDNPGDRLEAAVTAARIAAEECRGAVFAPLSLGGAGALRASGPVEQRLRRWIEGMEDAIRAAMRHLDDIQTWQARAQDQIAGLSGRTPPALVRVMVEWPLVSAPMAEKLTGASRAAVQRNLAWMQRAGLIREVTGQGRFRMWRARLRAPVQAT
ncbi:helix-turn-helix domain-containing protein [Albidovulum inexpectatum]|nr:helix-turn-helix domain-containing protein [Albidovulum inexpectatum]